MQNLWPFDTHLQIAKGETQLRGSVETFLLLMRLHDELLAQSNSAFYYLN